MRVALAILTVLAALAVASPAHATCDGCCDRRSTLIGWSEDALTYAYIESVEGEERLVVERHDDRRGPVVLAEWSSYADGDGPVCVDPTPRIPRDRGPGTLARLDVATSPLLRAYRLRPVARAWRDGFDLAITPGGEARFRDAQRLPFPFAGAPDGVACSTWQLAGGRAMLPRRCDPDLTDTPDIAIRGGYRHPTRSFYLLKLRLSHVGLATSDRFVIVDLRA